MKRIILAVALAALIPASMTAMAKDGGDSLRMQPFSGDVNKATEREQISIYYKMAKAQADYAEKHAQK